VTADPILSVRGLTRSAHQSRRYRRRHRRLSRGPNLHLGENGSGKTTLLESCWASFLRGAKPEVLDRPGTPLSARAFLTGAAVYVSSTTISLPL